MSEVKADFRLNTGRGPVTSSSCRPPAVWTQTSPHFEVNVFTE